RLGHFNGHRHLGASTSGSGGDVGTVVGRIAAHDHRRLGADVRKPARSVLGFLPLFCGSRLPVDSRVVGGLTFTWGGVTETTVDPSVVVPPQAGGSPTVDPFGRGVFNIRDGFVGAVVEYCGVDAFGLI